MSSVVYTGLRRFWRSFTWSNSREAWRERFSLVLVLTAVLLGWFYRAALTAGQQALLAVALVAVFAGLFRRGWLRLFGPVLLYDLIRLGRNHRYFLFRTAYACSLLFLLVWIYLVWLLDSSDAGNIHANELANFSSWFTYLFLSIQFLIVVILTPVCTGGAIAEEKEKRTLEFLLATDLRNREIVLSKLVARLAGLLLITMIGLPVISLMLFLGGVDPNLVLAGFAVTGLSMASLAGMSILASVWCGKPRDAVALTFLVTGAYLVIANLSQVALVPGFGYDHSTLWVFQNHPVTVAEVVNWINAGNIVAFLFQLNRDLVAGNPLDEILPGLLCNYALFHGGVALGCVSVAVARMRAVALKQLHGAAPRPSLAARVWGRPPVGSLPVLWKEVFAEPGLKVSWFGRVVIGVLIAVSIAPGVWIAALFTRDADGALGNTLEELGLAMNLWVRVSGTIVACLLLMAVAVRAASTISSERDRQTYDGLLTSPLEGHTILLGKWLGSILSIRWLWLWPGAIWAVGIVTGGLQVLAVPLLLVAWTVYAGFVAAVGVWFSLVCRTSLRASIWTMLVAVTASVGHWFLMILCVYLPLQSLSGPEAMSQGRWVLECHLFSLTPPATLFALTLQGWEFQDDWTLLSADDAWRYTWFALGGVVVWAGMTVLLGILTHARFLVLAHRRPLPRPEFSLSPAGDRAASPAGRPRDVP
jgi:ABC-type transport system involved in multi-copper enzyme maturation permease subunit